MRLNSKKRRWLGVKKQSPSPYSLSWNVYYTKAADPTIVKGLAVQELLKTKLKNPSEYKNKLKILRDYQTPSPYSSFRNDVLETSVYSNIGKISAQQEYDLIGLYKKGIAFIPDPEFNKLINNVDPVMALQYKNHRKIIQDLLINKQFNNINYEILLDEEDYIYFVRISRADE